VVFVVVTSGWDNYLNFVGGGINIPAWDMGSKNAVEWTTKISGGRFII